MVRTATINDAEQLNILNDEFNGEGDTSIDNIRNSLMNNKQEVVIVADEDDMLVGFVCVQLRMVKYLDLLSHMILVECYETIKM